MEPPKAVTLDPVCGMEVDEQQPGDTCEYKKKIYYSCSTECRDKFEHHPAGYTGYCGLEVKGEGEVKKLEEQKTKGG